MKINFLKRVIIITPKLVGALCKRDCQTRRRGIMANTIRVFVKGIHTVNLVLCKRARIDLKLPTLFLNLHYDDISVVSK